MSAIGILTALLVFAYFGSMLVGGRALRGFGLPSGTEFLLLGVIGGPKVLDVISGSAIKTMEPVVIVAIAWSALAIGLHYGNTPTRRVPTRRLIVATVLGASTLLLVSGAVAIAAWFAAGVRGRDLLVLSLGAGCAGTETTRYAVRWVSERYQAKGDVVDLVTDFSEADDFVPLVALALVWALGAEPEAGSVNFPMWLSFIGPVVIGGVLGATMSALTDAESRPAERWGLILGTALLGIGATMRLRESALTAMFAMGLTLSVLSRDRSELRAMFALTERPVMLPVLVLAGASVSLPNIPRFYLILVAAIVARVGAKLWAGFALRSYEVPSASGSLGLGLLPSGVLTLMVGLSSSIRFPGPIGDAILALAAVSTVFGEIVGSVMLRREMIRAGELEVPIAVPVPRAHEAENRLSLDPGRRSFAPHRARTRRSSRQESQP